MIAFHKELCKSVMIGCGVIFILLMWSGSVKAQIQYEQGVWVSYTDFHQVNDIVVGRDEIYIATSGGVLRYQRYRHEWLDPWVIGRGAVESVDLRNAVNVDYLPDDNEVAVLTPRGAYVYDYVFKTWRSTEHDFEAPLPANLFEATFLDLPDYTISRRTYFNQGPDTIMDNNLRKFYMTIYADDQWSTLWISLEGVGVIQLDKHTKQATVWELGQYGRDVRAIARGRGWTVLAGHNRDGGITFWKRRKNIWDHLEREYTTGLESTWINDLAVSGKWLLAATDYGLTQINLKTGTARTWSVYEGLWSNQVTAVAVDKDTVWVGTDDGLCKLFLPKGPVKRVEQKAIRSQPVYRLAVDHQAVWAGGELGLFRLDKKTGSGGFLGLSGGVGGPVYALHSDGNELWVGRDTGVEVVNKKTLEQTGYPAQAFFDGAEVYSVLSTDSLLWIGTNAGLWKFDRYRNKWHQYDNEDGLIDNRVTALYRDGDYLLLGTPEGVTRFFWNDPNRVD